MFRVLVWVWGLKFNSHTDCVLTAEREPEIRQEFGSRVTDKDGKPVESPSRYLIFRWWLSPFISQYYWLVQEVRFDREAYDSLYVKIRDLLVC
jgi:hypothetical protein